MSAFGYHHTDTGFVSYGHSDEKNGRVVALLCGKACGLIETMGWSMGVEDPLRALGGVGGQ